LAVRHLKKGKGYLVSSFLEDENQMVIDAEVQYISEHLFDEWMNANLDEGTFFADYRFAEMCDSNYLKGRFNRHYNLTPEDEHYIEWDEEK